MPSLPAQQVPEVKLKKEALLKYLQKRNPTEDYSKHDDFGCLLSGYFGSKVDDTFVYPTPTTRLLLPKWAIMVSRMSPRTFGAAASRLKAIMPVDIVAGQTGGVNAT